MTEYNILNMKLSNSQLSKLTSGIKNGTEVTNLSLNWLVVLMIGLQLICKFDGFALLSQIVNQVI